MEDMYENNEDQICISEYFFFQTDVNQEQIKKMTFKKIVYL